MISRRNIAIAVSCIVVPLAVLMSFTALRNAARRIVSDFYYPFLCTLPAAENFALESSLAMKSRSRLAAELVAGQEKLLKAQAELETTMNLRRENRDLRNLLGLAPTPGYKYVFAEIFLRDPVSWNEKFTIDKGKKHGIGEGDIVLTPSLRQEVRSEGFAVVGRVESVSDRTAVVSTLLDSDCSAGVFLAASKVAGVTAGGFRRGDAFFAYARYLPKEISYTEGEYVSTSSLSALNPPGLPVGRFRRLVKDGVEGADLNSTAELECFADFSRMRFFIVMAREDE